MPNGARTRRDVWKLQRDPQDPTKWDPILLWYGKAVGEMQGRAGPNQLSLPGRRPWVLGRARTFRPTVTVTGGVTA